MAERHADFLDCLKRQQAAVMSNIEQLVAPEPPPDTFASSSRMTSPQSWIETQRNDLLKLDIEGMTERVTSRITAAMAKTQQGLKTPGDDHTDHADDANEEDHNELLAIDFRALPNNFKILEEELASVRFQMPRRWTKKYAGSVKEDVDRVKEHPVPAIKVPVYTVKSPPMTSKTELIETDQVEVKRGYAYERPTRSMNDLARTESSVERHDYLSPDFMREKFPNRATSADVALTDGAQNKNDYKKTTYLEGAVSSHYGLMDKPLKAFNDQCYREQVCVTPSEEIRAADMRIDQLREYIRQNRYDVIGLPKIGDKQTSKSKKHISVGVQAAAEQKKSDFELYVDMKRKSSNQNVDDTNTQNRHGGQYVFLRDLPVDHYMTRHRTRANDSSENTTHFGPIKKDPLNHWASLDKKSKKTRLPTYMKRAAHAATLVDSDAFLDSNQDVHEDSTRRVYVRNPTVILPQSQRHILLPTPSQESPSKRSRAHRYPTSSQSRHDYCSRTRCTSSILEMVNSCEPFSRYRFADSNNSIISADSVESFSRGWNGRSLTLNTIVNSAANVLKTHTRVLSAKQSRKHVSNAVQHREQKLDLPMNPELMRRYLSEATFSMKELSQKTGFSKPRLCYKNSAPTQAHQLLIIPRQRNNSRADYHEHTESDDASSQR